MSSAQSLREFIRERLTAAAEEIFTAVDETIVHYEEELDRQRRLLEICWKPQIKLQRIDLFSPSTSTSSFSETHFNSASPTGYSMKLYQPPCPDLYSPSPLFMGEFVDPDIQPEDKKVVQLLTLSRNPSTNPGPDSGPLAFTGG
ncbi:hypothetical protein CHARACLAT_026793 [Characodon lateralis]|uniref:Uncharacterized protein n=1 Tax=Characodon lateralis TaxID=208331 RepID=A0ABU7CSA4_9TELE|nr:hypothetical protein [Characodon lateralis]